MFAISSNVYLHRANTVIGVFLILMLTISFASAAQNKPKIVWQDLHYPPIGFTTGPFNGTGFMQETRNWFIDRLPKFEHEIREIAIARFVEVSNGNEVMCSTFLVPTEERKNFLSYSKPIFQMRTVSLIVAMDRIEDANTALDHDYIDLSLIAAQNRLSVGWPVGYRFGEEFDQQLKDLSAAPLTEKVGELPILVRMFEAKRLDALLAYEANMTFHRRQGQLTRDTVSYPLKNTRLQQISVSCTKSPLGDELINDVNLLMGKEANRRDAAQFYAQWISADRRDRFLQNLSD